MKRPPVCILTSPGIQSLALLHRFNAENAQIYPVFIQCGFRWEEAELHWLKKTLREVRYSKVEQLEILSMPLRESYSLHWALTGVNAPRKESEEVYLPGRNLLLLSRAAVFCSMKGIEVLVFGMTKGYAFPDGGSAFLKSCEEIFKPGLNSEVEIRAPFLEKTKEEVLFEFKDASLDATFSCASPKGFNHCGECFKCAERKKAFLRTGITDKTRYYQKMF